MIRKMNETELAIQDISDVRMIHIYGLKHGVPAIAVFYGKGRQFNLSSEDEYFDLLSDRIFELYGSETDRDRIIMDATTRRILESGCVDTADCFDEAINSLCVQAAEGADGTAGRQTAEGADGTVGRQAADGADGTAGRQSSSRMQDLPMDSALSRRFTPIASYLLTSLYSAVGRDLSITGTKTGWRGAGAVYGLVAGEHKTFSFRVNRLRYDLFTMSIGNFLADHHTLTVRLSFGPDNILMSYSADYAETGGTSRFVFDAGGMTESHSIFCSGEQVYRDSRRTENSVGEAEAKAEADVQASLLPHGLSPVAYYPLPFGIDYVLYEHQTVDGDTVKCSSLSGFIYHDARFADMRRWVRVTDKTAGLTIISKTSAISRLLLRDGSMIQNIRNM